MYEVDFTGWTRTPEELEKVKVDLCYRFKLNFIRVYKSIIYRRFGYGFGRNVWNVIINRNDF